MSASPYRTPDAPEKKRLPLLADLTVKTPCRVAWKSMDGDERRRFCFACSKEVYDLTRMTEDEAEAFLAVHLDDDDECVRLYRRPDGRVLTSDCPVGATRRHRWRAMLAVVGGAMSIIGVAALAGDLHVPRNHSVAREIHSRYEPPRLSTHVAVRTTIAPESALGMGVAGPLPEDWRYAEPDPPRPRQPDRTVRGRLLEVSFGYSPEIVARVLREEAWRFRSCYMTALAHDSFAAVGVLDVTFTIARDGTVSAMPRTSDPGTTLSDPLVTNCMARGIWDMTFPPPETMDVEVKYRLALSRD